MTMSLLGGDKKDEETLTSPHIRVCDSQSVCSSDRRSGFMHVRKPQHALACRPEHRDSGPDSAGKVRSHRLRVDIGGARSGSEDFA